MEVPATANGGRVSPRPTGVGEPGRESPSAPPPTTEKGKETLPLAGLSSAELLLRGNFRKVWHLGSRSRFFCLLFCSFLSLLHVVVARIRAHGLA